MKNKKYNNMRTFIKIIFTIIIILAWMVISQMIRDALGTHYARGTWGTILDFATFFALIAVWKYGKKDESDSEEIEKKIDDIDKLDLND